MKRHKLRKLRLSLFFALIVFVVMLVSMLLVLGGAALLDHFGLLTMALAGRVPLFYFALVSLLVGTAIAFLSSGRPLKPLREIMDAADKIADGDYSVRLDLRGLDEFQQLSKKFNHMAEALGSVEMLRRDFIGNFSHEFKTPIVSIRGFAKALKWEALPEEEKNEYLDIIIAEAERLSELSSKVLYLSKIETQASPADQERLNLTEQLRLVLALLDRKMEEKHLHIVFEGGDFFIEGNAEMLKQVWINLLDNAIKFSPEAGTIRIRVKESAGGVSVKIADEGAGIPPEARAHIFDKFYQADRSHASAGNGLGLAIVKKIVDLHGGDIALRSSDRGTAFLLTFSGSPHP